jgi:hypothetical protein
MPIERMSDHQQQVTTSYDSWYFKKTSLPIGTVVVVRLYSGIPVLCRIAGYYKFLRSTNDGGYILDANINELSKSAPSYVIQTDKTEKRVFIHDKFVYFAEPFLIRS